MAKPKVNRPDIGRKLAALMAASPDLRSASALSRRTKVGQSTISRLLRGEGNPSLAILDRLAKPFAKTARDLAPGHPVHSHELAVDNAESQAGRASQSAGLKEGILASALEDLGLLETIVGVAPDPLVRARRLIEIYDHAIEDGGRITRARLTKMMEAAIRRPAEAKDGRAETAGDRAGGKGKHR